MRILAAGNFYLDTIVVRDYPEGPAQQRNFTEKVVIEEVGATCGNVVSILAHLGEEVYPIAKLDDSPEGKKIADDLRRYGCSDRFVTNTPDGGTTTLRCTHKMDAEGNKVVKFRAGSPGGSRFPRKRVLRGRDEAPAFLESLDFTPDVFFFDTPDMGHRVLAKGLREKGSLVYFEPEGMKDNSVMKSIEVSDIVKFSGERIPDTAFTDAFKDKLFIQTLGDKGLRFRLRGGAWVELPAVPVEKVVDWEGAGDWTTSMIIHGLCQRGILSVKEMTKETITEVLQEAQKVASRSVGYLSSKGMIHAEMRSPNFKAPSGSL